MHTSSVAALSSLSRLTSITIGRVPGCALDLRPLRALPHLSKLHLWSAHAQHSGTLCFSELLSLRDLALLGFEVSWNSMSVLRDELDAVLSQGSLEQLQVAVKHAAYQLVIPQDSPLHTLLVSAWYGIPEGVEGQLSKLKVLALYHVSDEAEPYLSALTALEALSLAGSSINEGNFDDEAEEELGLCPQQLTHMTRLRVLDLRCDFQKDLHDFGNPRHPGTSKEVEAIDEERVRMFVTGFYANNQVYSAFSSHAIPKRLDLWTRDRSEPSCAVNHQGTLIITSRGFDLTVWRLKLTSQRSLKRVVWKGSAEAFGSLPDVTYTWSKLDAYVAILVSCPELDAVYVYNTGEEGLDEVAFLPEDAEHFFQPQFNSTEQQLILPWRHADTTRMYLNIYDPATCQHTAKVPVNGEQFPRRFFEFEPNTGIFATTSKESAVLFDSSGQLVGSAYNITCGSSSIFPKIAFSPSGSQLAMFHECGQGSESRPHVEICDIASGARKQFHGPADQSMLQAVSTARYLHMSLYSLVTIIGSRMKLFSLKQESFGQQVQIVHDVRHNNVQMSPDGIFLAAIVHKEAAGLTLGAYCLQIYELATGRLLHSYPTDEWLSAGECSREDDNVTITLHWASSGLCLFVGVSNLSYGAADEREMTQTLFTFAF
ncbi:hypothetical protein WJX73_006626 [Symbiochloris irregularis]|uniref:Uncharacterized protein n=1 Tax=Symbiochloris irregularis TaxID=706552 RepID=A0AAW1PE37_9CHLO